MPDDPAQQLCSQFKELIVNPPNKVANVLQFKQGNTSNKVPINQEKNDVTLQFTSLIGGLTDNKNDGTNKAGDFAGFCHVLDKIQMQTSQKPSPNKEKRKYNISKPEETLACKDFHNVFMEHIKKKPELLTMKEEVKKEDDAKIIVSNNHHSKEEPAKVEPNMKNDKKVTTPKQAEETTVKVVKSVEATKPARAEKQAVAAKIILRLQYSVADVVAIRDNPTSKTIINSVKLAFTGFEPYLRKKVTKEPKFLYKRSDNAWVRVSERLKKCAPDEAQFEKFKISVQTAINKFNRNNKNKVKDELQALDVMKSPKHMEFFIDCVYRSVARYGGWIKEFAGLCYDLSAQMKDEKKKFLPSLIAKFFEGTKIPAEWLAKYSEVKNRKVNTVDDLDDVNEQLQTLERYQGSVCLGCAKMLAYLQMFKIYPQEEAVKFIKALLVGKELFDLEMLCTFLTCVGPEMEANKQGFLKETLAALKKKKKNLSLRHQFIIEELTETIERPVKPTVSSKMNVTVSSVPSTRKDLITSGTSDINFMPNRRSSTATSSNKSSQFQEKNVTTVFSNKSKPSEQARNEPTAKQESTERFKPGAGKSKINLFGSSNTQKQSSRPAPEPVKETNEAPAFTYEVGRTSLLPLLNIFLEQYDTHRLISELKEYEIANNMDMFVKISYLYFADQVTKNFVYVGHMLRILMEGGRLTKSDFMKGFSEFLSQYNDLVLDIPTLLSCISRSLIPLILSQRLTLDEYYEVAQKNGVEDVNSMIPDIMKEITDHANVVTWVRLWKESEMSKKINMDHLIDHLEISEDDPCVYPDANLYPSINESFTDIFKDDSIDNIECATQDYCKVLHLCCPSGWPEFVEAYLEKVFAENQAIFVEITKSEPKLHLFFSQIAKIVQLRNNMPSCLIRCLAAKMISSKLCQLSAIEKAFNGIDSDMCNIALHELRTAQ